MHMYVYIHIYIDEASRRIHDSCIVRDNKSIETIMMPRTSYQTRRRIKSMTIDY